MDRSDSERAAPGDRSSSALPSDFVSAPGDGLWLAPRAERTPRAPAVRCGGLEIDYQGLERRVARLAFALALEGIGPERPVAVLVPAGLPAVVLFHALLRRGATLLPLNARLTAVEHRYQLEDAGVRTLVVAGPEALARGRALADELALDLLRLDAAATLQPDRKASAAAPPRVLPKGAAMILYTSGTTGRPKGALLSASALEASALGSAQLLGASPDDRWLACMPLFHVGGLSILVRSVIAGSCVVVHERFDPETVSESLDRDGITMISLVADMLRRLIDVRCGGPPPRSLRCILLGGGPAPASLLRRAEAAGYRVAPTYGLTEAASQVATRPPDAPAGLVPLPGTRLRIVDETGEERPQGEPGEICVQGPTLMDGYWGRPDETARALRGGWLHTGDHGVLDERGRLKVLDRREDLIVSGGENVYPAEVEAVLESHPGVGEAAVIATPDERFGFRPLALFVPAGGRPPDEEALRAFCRARLAGYKVPVRFEARLALPHNASGKLLRRALRETPAP